jgi:PAT family beta-lactamase induction signal transducer AmpG
MRSSDPRIAASMFAILMAVTNIAQAGGMAASGFLTDAVAFRWTFIVLAALNLVVLPLRKPALANSELGVRG